MSTRWQIITFLWFAAATAVKAQVSVFNLAEFQHGNIPGVEPAGVNSVYDQLNIDYRLKGLRANVRLENYYSSDSIRSKYTQISQYSLNYRKRGLNLKAGHFYETLGKGLLFRGYEIKNSVYEDQIYRVKQGFYRDARGLAGSYTNKRFSIKALHGKVLINQLPLNNPDNRLDQVSAAEAGIRVLNQRVGLIFLQNKNPNETSEYMSVLLGGNLFAGFDYYTEVAYRSDAQNKLLSFQNDDSYGAYFNLAYSTSGFGVTFELKDYQNLFIGSGISDPPTLVKEHIYRLLNRSTHVPFYFDESGAQIEMFIVPGTKHMITLNHSRSLNQLGQTNFRSGEYFADWHFNTSRNNQLKVFADYSFDDLVFENARYTTGVYYTHLLKNTWSFSVESEYQLLKRKFDENKGFHNIYLGLILNQSTRFSSALVFEYTSDTKYADLPGTPEIETRQFYPGVNLSFQPNKTHKIQLFAGKRRGGPACTSGVCYEVLDFKGVEIRWSVKL